MRNSNGWVNLLYIWNNLCEIGMTHGYIVDNHSLYNDKIREQDRSGYLVKEGDEAKISWVGKPEKSFRIAGHWSWYANVKKAPSDIIQCYCPEVGEPEERDPNNPNHATHPINRKAICLYENGVYKVIAGWDGKLYKMPNRNELEALFI